MAVFLQVGANKVLLDFFLPEFSNRCQKRFRILGSFEYRLFVGTCMANFPMGTLGQRAYQDQKPLSKRADQLRQLFNILISLKALASKPLTCSGIDLLNC